MPDFPNVPLCINCRHLDMSEVKNSSDPRQVEIWARCARTKMVNAVSGFTDMKNCSIERVTGSCAREGKHFEAAGE